MSAPMTPPDLAPVIDRLLAGSGRTRVLVVGDVMLDEYVIGTVERQSPEAPVPVLRASTTTSGLGGAANVARQLAAFRAHVELLGVIGVDGPGDRVVQACREAAIGTRLLVRDATATTTTKQRLVAGGHQIARVDREDLRPLPDEVAAQLASALLELPVPDVVVVSDYAKGVVTDRLLEVVLEAAERWQAPVLVDPAPGALDRYRGATLIKANQAEFEAAIGAPLGADPADGVARHAPAAMDRAGIAELVVTLGDRGMVVIGPDAPPTLLPATALEVFDVSGAGDTVVAVLALCRAWGEPLASAAHLANEAAGMVVRKQGVSVVDPADVVARLGDRPEERVLGPDALAARVAAWRARGDRIVFTNGCFDLLHHGHLHLLREAAMLGDRLVVAVNGDGSVARLKGEGRPRLGIEERALLLAGISCVGAVTVFDEDDPLAVIVALAPDVLVKGADYAPDEIVGAAEVLAAGGEVVTIPLRPGPSTTAIAAEQDRLGSGR